jgi:uncharacterized membrane protein YoaK (UPF0700 family)
VLTGGVDRGQTLAQPAVRRIVRRPTRWVLIAEIVVLAAVAAVPLPSRVVPGAIAFVAAVQVSTFRSLHGVEYSSTFTTSNLRAVTANIFAWRTGHDPASRHRAAAALMIVLVALVIETRRLDRRGDTTAPPAS